MRLRRWFPLRSTKRVLACAATFFMLASAQASDAPRTCPNGQAADGVLHVGNARHCLLMRHIEPARARPGVLAVFLHGDNRGRIELHTDRGPAFHLASQLQLPTVALQRPGYQSGLGRSDGYNLASDDDYTGTNVEIVATALGHLRQLHPDKKLLLIGHSGGSAMTALVAARFPASADAYLVVACPCDIAPWREWRNTSAGRTGTWPNSLSPLAEADSVPAGTRIALVVGSKDDNTLPKFSDAFVARLQSRGVQAQLVHATDATHSSVLRSPELFKLAGDMAVELAQMAALESQ